MKITLQQLRVFVAIADKANMGHAAEVVHLSQSACSMALATMEKQLGRVLFDRHGKKLTLNEYGRALLPKAMNILKQVNEFQSLAQEQGNTTFIGDLIVGASSTVGNYLLPKKIGKFIEAYPEVKITLNVANTEQIIKQILEFRIDVGIIEGSCYAKEIEVTPWGEDELIIIASPKHPLSKKRKIKLAEIQACRWILREPGSGTREQFEAAMGGKVTPFLELGHTEAIKNAVQENIGISCLSRITVAEALKSRQIAELKVPSLKLTRNFYLLLHKEKHQTALLKEFIKKSMA